MHGILVAVGSPGQVAEVERNIFDTWRDGLNFHPKHVRVARTKTSFVFSAEMQNPIFSDGSVSISDNGTFAFAGVPLIDDLAVKGKYGADDIAQHLRTLGPRRFRQGVASSYAVVDVSAERLIAFSDLCGRYPWFYKKAAGLVIVSNVLSLLAENRQRLSARAATSLCVHSQIWGDEIFPGVELLKTGQVLIFDEYGLRTMSLDDDWGWFGAYDIPSVAGYETASDRLLQTFKTLGTLVSTKISLGLSGGKDSRVMAAYAVRAGLGDNLDVFTSGIENSPEFEISARVRSVLGVAGREIVGRPANLTAEAYWPSLRAQIGRYKGLLLPVSGSKERFSSNPRIEISGFGGELYRRGIAKQFVTKPIKNIDDACARWRSYHVPPDVNRVIRDEVVRKDADWMASWVKQKIAEGYDPQALPELFFVSYRVPLHQGIASMASGAKLYVDPLIHPKLQKTHFLFGRFAGEAELTHCALLWYAKRELCSVPFVKDKWHDSLGHIFPQGALAFDSFAAGASDKFIRPFAWEFFSEAKDKVKSTFSAETELFEFVDRSKLNLFLDSDGALKSTAAANQMFTILGLQLHMTGDVEPPKDGPPLSAEFLNRGSALEWGRPPL